MKLERSDVQFPVWRKKVDASLFRKAHTPIPNWCVRMWNISSFGTNTSKKNIESKVQIHFERIVYEGWITYSFSKDTNYQLYLSPDFVERLKDIFVMTYMRSLEQRLRKVDSVKEKYLDRDIETEVPFWEFLDFEFDQSKRSFLCKAHYTQVPLFPELFQQLVRSHVLKDMENRLLHKGDFKFIKENWKPRHESVQFLERSNIIYYLLDTKNKLLYIGEGEHSDRIFHRHAEILSWDFFRVDCLPLWLSRSQRLELERLTIRSFAAILTNPSKVPTKQISEYKLVNKKIDR